MTEPAIDLDAGALEPNALRAARIAFVKWKAERKPGDEGGPLSAGIRAYLAALPARAPLDAEALEKALADTPKNDRYPKIQAIRAYLAALHATGAGEWRPIETAPRDGTPFWAIQWFQSYTQENTGRWSDPVKYAFATQADDEQCWHSIPRQSCIREIGSTRWKWMLIPPLPAPPLPSPQSRV